ncbi:MAG: ribonuclease E/G [Eubacteriales bacterium]|nr:ribonuclease E/G [Eubacteriales bacterium]
MNSIYIIARVPAESFAPAKASAASGHGPVLTSFLLEEDRLTEVYPHFRSVSLLGNIYVGKVKNVIQNIQAAFVEIGGGQICYLPFSEAESPILTNRPYDGRLLAGDEILVQVVRDAIKTKAPSLTARLSIEGRFAAVSLDGGHGLRFSRQLSPETVQDLKQVLQSLEIPSQMTLVVRTRAGEEGGAQALPGEAKQLLERAKRLLSIGKTRTVFSLISEEKPEWLSCLEALPQPSKIVTDEISVYTALESVRDRFADTEISLYRDPKVSLFSLYGLSSKLSEALDKRVWLKSGGYLVIEPTEALTVIDVNTGKFDGKRPPEETFSLINREAALETARQLRLRSLSGIILVDFINQNPEHTRELLALLRKVCASDPVPVRVVDVTPLGLVEITRKKRRPPLAELIRKTTGERV